MITIWHHPRCSKSRQTLALIQARDTPVTIRHYQQDGPSETELRQALDTLGLRPVDLIRTGDALFKELGLAKTADDATLIAAMAAHPALIERPVVFANGRAAIGRPPEAVLDIL